MKLCTFIALAGFAGAAFAEVIITGRVVQGANEAEGIYAVKVQIVHGAEELAFGRSDENGYYRISLRETGTVPATLVARFSKPSFKRNPTEQVFSVSTSTKLPIALPSARLIPEGANDTYLAKLNESLFRVQSIGNQQEVATFIPLIRSLPGSKRDALFEQIERRDPTFAVSLRRAEAFDLATSQYQADVRTSNPSAIVVPDFRNWGITDAQPKTNIYLNGTSRPLPEKYGASNTSKFLGMQQEKLDFKKPGVLDRQVQ